MEILKKCSICGEEKPLDKFQIARTCKDGKMPYCAKCRAQKEKERYIKNRDRLIAGTKLWQKNNPAKKQLYIKRLRWARETDPFHGITHSDEKTPNSRQLTSDTTSGKDQV